MTHTPIRHTYLHDVYASHAEASTYENNNRPEGAASPHHARLPVLNAASDSVPVPVPAAAAAAAPGGR